MATQRCWEVGVWPPAEGGGLHRLFWNLQKKVVFFLQTVSRASASGFALKSEQGRRQGCRRRTKGVPSLSPVFSKGEWITLSIYIPETHARILAWRIPMDRGAWRAKSPWGHKESDTTEWLSTHPCTHISLQQSVQFPVHMPLTGELAATGRPHSWCPSAEWIHGNPPSSLHGGASSRFPFRGANLGLHYRRWSRWTLLVSTAQSSIIKQSHDRQNQTASRHRVRKI